MTQVSPLYITYIKEDDKIHLSVGKSPKTLCGTKKVTSALQIDDPDNPLKIIESGELCPVCEEKWEIAKEYVRLEPTVECDRCSHVYSAPLSRSVEHMDRGEVTVCRSCYKDLYHSEDSGVSKEFSESDPYYPMSGNREFDLPTELKQEWDNINISELGEDDEETEE